MTIKGGGGFRPLLEKNILNFHFDYLKISLSKPLVVCPLLQRYDKVADVAESSLQWRSDFQSVKKRFYISSWKGRSWIFISPTIHHKKNTRPDAFSAVIAILTQSFLISVQWSLQIHVYSFVLKMDEANRKLTWRALTKYFLLHGTNVGLRRL